MKITRRIEKFLKKKSKPKHIFSFIALLKPEEDKKSLLLISSEVVKSAFTVTEGKNWIKFAKIARTISDIFFEKQNIRGFLFQKRSKTKN